MSYRPEAHWLEKYNRWHLNAYNDDGQRNWTIVHDASILKIISGTFLVIFDCLKLQILTGITWHFFASCMRIVYYFILNMIRRSPVISVPGRWHPRRQAFEPRPHSPG
jgi:hypothetical protein